MKHRTIENRKKIKYFIKGIYKTNDSNIQHAFKYSIFVHNKSFGAKNKFFSEESFKLK